MDDMDDLEVGASAVPPQHVMPALLPLNVIVHRQPALVLTLTHAEVYPSGCALFLSLRANIITRDDQRFLGDLLTNYARDKDVGEFTAAIVRDGKRHVAEFLTVRDGGVFYRFNVWGGGQHHRMSYWVSPLPSTACSLEFHSPPLGIDRAEVVLDPALLAETALRAEELWPGWGGEDQVLGVV
jgi:hypothetical protein